MTPTTRVVRISALSILAGVGCGGGGGGAGGGGGGGGGGGAGGGCGWTADDIEADWMVCAG